MDMIIEKLEKQIHSMFHKESSGHDIHHLRRTYNLAMKLQENEGGDRLIIGVSAYLHDVHRIIQNETGKHCSPKDSLPEVKKILDKIDLNEEQNERILHCIELHEEYAFSKEGVTAGDIETLIVQDADNLDGIGAIGIGRTFSYNGAHGIPMWEPDIPFSTEEYYDESIHDPSAVHHFKNKLMRLADHMNTATAKRMAKKRNEFMHDFFEQFFAEWEGKK